VRENFAPSLARVLQSEGGKVDDPQDPGGRTAFGITQRVYDDWRGQQGLPKHDVWTIRQSEIEAIYRMNYWNTVRADELPAGVDYAVFDFAVNSGVNRAARYLQRAVGVADDGKIGPMTLAAVKAKPACETIAAISAARLNFLGQLPTFARFGRGWTARVADVGLHAAEMAA
jgi:lysozyme family protein